MYQVPPVGTSLQSRKASDPPPHPAQAVPASEIPDAPDRTYRINSLPGQINSPLMPENSIRGYCFVYQEAVGKRSLWSRSFAVNIKRTLYFHNWLLRQ